MGELQEHHFDIFMEEVRLIRGALEAIAIALREINNTRDTDRQSAQGGRPLDPR